MLQWMEPGDLDESWELGNIWEQLQRCQWCRFEKEREDAGAELRVRSR